ncbi:MAG: hypothetical protein ACXWMW_13590, partial [Syntrophales bacterium]
SVNNNNSLAAFEINAGTSKEIIHPYAHHHITIDHEHLIQYSHPGCHKAFLNHKTKLTVNIKFPAVPHDYIPHHLSNLFGITYL